MYSLNPGDSIDIIAPATGCSKQDVETVKNLVTSWHLIPRVPTDLFGEDLLCINSDEKRFAQLKDALFNTESKAIWCLKGGYGCARLIPELEKLAKPTQPKLLIGFSDTTVLHLFLQQKWNWQTLHGPGARQVALETIDDNSIQEIKNIIFGNQKIIKFKLSPLNKAAKKNISIDSIITGGTLSLIQTSLGTSWQIDSKNKILFLEDCNERGYKIDRMLQHLKQASVFSDIKAVIFGNFIGGQEPEGFSLVDKVLQRFAEENNFPVLSCPDIGHGKVNRPLPFGTSANLTLGTTNLLTAKI